MNAYNTKYPQLSGSSYNEVLKRLRFYKAALDLLRNSQINPDTIASTEDQRMLLYRFYGVTKDGSYFCIQVKEDIGTKRKDFMSVFDRKPH